MRTPSNQNPGKRKSHAFTLIELLVVIAIISLLVSILIPSLQKAKDLAKGAVCLSNLRNIGLAIYQYITDNDGTIVPSASTGSGEIYLAQPLWYDRLAANQYLEYSAGLLANGIFASAPTQEHVLHCPADDQNGRNVGFCSYSTNRHIAGLLDGVNYPPPYNAHFKVHKIEEFHQLGNIILAAEQGNLAGPMGSWWSPFGANAYWFSGYASDGMGFTWTRHNRESKVYDDIIVNARGNALILDGHVETCSGDFDVNPAYPGAGVRYLSPGSPFPLMNEW